MRDDAASRETPPDADDQGLDFLDLLLPIAQNLKLLIIGPLLLGGLALGMSYAIEPTFTARTTLLPPQQQQSSAAAALTQLGALAGLASGVANIKSPADQYVALLESTTVVDRLVERFDLMQVYESDFRFQARKALAGNVRVAVGKKDGLISIQVDDVDPQRAADLANAHVEELRALVGKLALTEAQQRRVFFEDQLKQTRDRLTQAQQQLEASGFTQGALRAEPKAAAEGYARLRAEVTAAEVRLQTLRRNLADNTPEVAQQQTTLSALRSQLAQLERSIKVSGDDPGYVGKYREFKYQETLFELFARQYELARLDESREGTLIQVVDSAAPPEWKSKPKRAILAIAATLCSLLFLTAYVVVRHFWRLSADDPRSADKMARLRLALRRR